GGGGRWRMSPRVRKANLVLHVICSVTWLGLDVGLLTLTLTGLTTDDTTTLRAAYVAMRLFGDVLLVPVALLALTTGVVLSLGTHWGLTRHLWVLVKLVLTLVAGTLTVFSLRPGLHEAARAALGTPADHGSWDLLAPPVVSMTMYVTMTVLSYYKPWGRTPWARRDRRRPGATAR
ncbi:hypothetical protein ACSNOI_22195, partial [Actinomadura kijaniata]|uniref:hypothetical protein n=1 Tax=Actinomadura kijaniata TaxID=46161 RepID=UPI003F1B0EB3